MLGLGLGLKLAWEMGSPNPDGAFPRVVHIRVYTSNSAPCFAAFQVQQIRFNLGQRLTTPETQPCLTYRIIPSSQHAT